MSYSVLFFERVTRDFYVLTAPLRQANTRPTTMLTVLEQATVSVPVTLVATHVQAYHAQEGHLVVVAHPLLPYFMHMTLPLYHVRVWRQLIFLFKSTN